MPMPPYPVHCYQPGCGQPALYKIAARWSDGVTEELKTYALACAGCLPELFRRSQRQAAPPAAWPRERRCWVPSFTSWPAVPRDRQLTRRPDLEEMPAVDVQDASA